MIILEKLLEKQVKVAWGWHWPPLGVALAPRGCHFQQSLSGQVFSKGLANILMHYPIRKYLI